MYIVTDTHPWVWFLTASPRLSQKAKSIIIRPLQPDYSPMDYNDYLKGFEERKRIKSDITF